MYDYEIEPWDSTSTNPRPPGKPMPSEAEGLGMAGERAVQMFNPAETVAGIGNMLSGIANDGVRLVGGTPKKGAPSFVGGIKELGRSAYNEPFQTALEVVTSPGSVPGLFTGVLPKKIPTGTGHSLLKDRPGYSKVREKLKGVGRYDFVPEGYKTGDRALTKASERRRPSNYYESPQYQQWAHNPALTFMDKQKYDPLKVVQKLARSDDMKTFAGRYIPDIDSVFVPRRNYQYRDPKTFHETTGNKHKIDDSWNTEIRRHENIHALDYGEDWFNALPNKNVKKFITELNAYTGGKKSIADGMNHMGRALTSGDYGKSMIAPGAVTKGIGAGLKGARYLPSALKAGIPSTILNEYITNN